MPYQPPYALAPHDEDEIVIPSPAPTSIQEYQTDSTHNKMAEAPGVSHAGEKPSTAVSTHPGDEGSPPRPQSSEDTPENDEENRLTFYRALSSGAESLKKMQSAISHTRDALKQQWQAQIDRVMGVQPHTVERPLGPLRVGFGRRHHPRRRQPRITPVEDYALLKHCSRDDGIFKSVSTHYNSMHPRYVEVLALGPLRQVRSRQPPSDMTVQQKPGICRWCSYVFRCGKARKQSTPIQGPEWMLDVLRQQKESQCPVPIESPNVTGLHFSKNVPAAS